MKFSLERLRRQAEATGFRPKVLEKVIPLLNLLEALRSHPFLKDRLAPGAGVVRCFSSSTCTGKPVRARPIQALQMSSEALRDGR